VLKGSETAPNVAVAIRTRIVEVQRHGARVSAIVPVGAREQGASDVIAFVKEMRIS